MDTIFPSRSSTLRSLKTLPALQGSDVMFGPVPASAATSNDPGQVAKLQRDLLSLGSREAIEIAGEIEERNHESTRMTILT